MSNQTKTTTTPIKRFGYLLGTFTAGILSYTTLTGDLQNHIHFAGVLNEIGFFIMGCMLTVICAICTCTE
jgi:hypothetical protein